MKKLILIAFVWNISLADINPPQNVIAIKNDLPEINGNEPRRVWYGVNESQKQTQYNKKDDKKQEVILYDFKHNDKTNNINN